MTRRELKKGERREREIEYNIYIYSISTDSNNNVTAVTLGDIEYTNIVYRASDAATVGLITAYTETIGGVSHEWNIIYESGTNLVTQVRKPPGPPTSLPPTILSDD